MKGPWLESPGNVLLVNRYACPVGHLPFIPTVQDHHSPICSSQENRSHMDSIMAPLTSAPAQVQKTSDTCKKGIDSFSLHLAGPSRPGATLQWNATCNSLLKSPLPFQLIASVSGLRIVVSPCCSHSGVRTIPRPFPKHLCYQSLLNTFPCYLM